MSEYGFVFDENKCTGCFGCTVACKSWRNVETGQVIDNELVTVRYRRIEKRWSGEFPKVSFRNFSVSCQHCAKPWCMEVCPVKAISKAENGVVTVDREKCIGCQTCLKACPFGVPQFSKKTKPAKMQKCDMCVNELDLSKDEPPCVATCNTKALNIKKLTSKEKEISEQKLMIIFS